MVFNDTEGHHSGLPDANFGPPPMCRLYTLGIKGRRPERVVRDGCRQIIRHKKFGGRGWGGGGAGIGVVVRLEVGVMKTETEAKAGGSDNKSTHSTASITHFNSLKRSFFS